MKKVTEFLLLFLMVVLFSNLILAQERVVRSDDSKFFFSNGNGSVENPMLTTTKPTLNLFSVEKQALLKELDIARLNDDQVNASKIQDQLDQLDGVKKYIKTNANYQDAGISANQQDLTQTESPFYSPNYFSTKIDDGGFWSVATFTSNRTSTIFAAATKYAGGLPDTLKIYASYNDGQSWVLKGKFNSFADGVDFRSKELDIEVITNGTDTLVFAVAGYTYLNHARTLIAKTNIVTGSTVISVFDPGIPAIDSINTYNPRITSDNSRYSSLVYVYLTTVRDSLTGSGQKHITYQYAMLSDPYNNMDITYKSPNGVNGFYWHQTEIPAATYLWQDIAYLNVNGTNRIYTVWNHDGSAITQQNLYLAFSDDYGNTLPKGLTLVDSKPVLSAKIAANGNNSNLCISYRRFWNPDWDIYSQYSSTGGDSLNQFTGSYTEGSSLQSPLLIDVQSIKNANGGFVFAWATGDSTRIHNYRRTNNNGQNYTAYLNSSTGSGDYTYGGCKAGYINNSVLDSSLTVWSIGNGTDVYCSKTLATPVGVEDDNNVIPNVYSLQQNYPNPFNPSTTIRFSIPEQTNVTLKIFNSIGQEVASLLNGQMAAGNHSVDFNASKLSSGVYFYRIDSPSFTSTKKMILIK